MMNNIYNFNDIEKIRSRQKRLVVGYALAVLCFIGVLALAFFILKNNIVLTVVFALLLFFFILSSIVFWKVKYVILSEHKTFLDNIETGIKSDYIGSFVGMDTDKLSEEPFDSYIFVSTNKSTSFLVYNQYSPKFIKGEKYHIEYVGSYLYRWESVR